MLEINGIHVYRGPAHILNGLSMNVKESEVVCLVGRNGAGKTTTIDSIMGLLPVRQGTISFQGRDITNMPTHLRAQEGLGYAPEDAGIFSDLSVAENIQLSKLLAGAQRNRKENGQDADARIDAVFPEVKGFMGRRGLFLSGGQKKMLAISRAMALSPSLLLLDEAFEGLAPVVVNRFHEAVGKIKSMGISILIAESNLVTAAQVADRLYAIDRGEIIFEGKPEAAKANAEVMRTLRG